MQLLSHLAYSHLMLVVPCWTWGLQLTSCLQCRAIHVHVSAALHLAAVMGSTCARLDSQRSAVSHSLAGQVVTAEMLAWQPPFFVTGDSSGGLELQTHPQPGFLSRTRWIGSFFCCPPLQQLCMGSSGVPALSALSTRYLKRHSTRGQQCRSSVVT